MVFISSSIQAYGNDEVCGAVAWLWEDQWGGLSPFWLLSCLFWSVLAAACVEQSGFFSLVVFPSSVNEMTHQLPSYAATPAFSENFWVFPYQANKLKGKFPFLFTDIISTNNVFKCLAYSNQDDKYSKGCKEKCIYQSNTDCYIHLEIAYVHFHHFRQRLSLIFVYITQL